MTAAFWADPGQGTVIGSGTGGSIAEALLCLRCTPPRAPYDGQTAYDDEPPF